MIEGSSYLLHRPPAEDLSQDGWPLPEPPERWRVERAGGVWSHLRSPLPLPSWGWKIHVSARLDEAGRALQACAPLAYDHECSFKYLTSRQSYLRLHAKEGSRLQSGKFIALYPHDEKTARALMEQLSSELADVGGSTVLTDRAFRGSASVFYRWGAFQSKGRISDEGKLEDLIPDGQGGYVPDRRSPYFDLPNGMQDPFIDEEPHAQPTRVDSITLGRYVVQRAYRFTNGGGIYAARCTETARDVVIKEARPHTGYVLDEEAHARLAAEAAWLRRAAAIRVGLAPEPIEEFAVEGHSFLVQERVPGTPMHDWISVHCPLYTSGFADRDVVVDYLKRLENILQAVRADLADLHDHGIAFGDLSPSNIMIDGGDRPRLIDFEACTDVNSTAAGVGTPDFRLVAPAQALPALERDRYALHALAIAGVLRLTSLAEHRPSVLDQVFQRLADVIGEIPDWLDDARVALMQVWSRSSALRGGDEDAARSASGPSGESVPADLCSALVRGILACRELDAPWIFPASASAVGGAPLSFSTGDSGVLYALARAGATLDESIIADYRDRLGRAVEQGALPLGHDHGLAGMLDTCRELGLDDVGDTVADQLLDRVTALRRPELGNGLAGVALTLLRHGHAEAARQSLTRALREADDYEWSKNGLFYGRSGLAAACVAVGRHTEDAFWFAQAAELLAREVTQLTSSKGRSPSLRAEPDGMRILPYLKDGTAGLLLTAALLHEATTLHGATGRDHPLPPERIMALTSDLVTPFVLEPSLADGVAGMAVVLQALRRLLPDQHGLPDPDWQRLDQYLLPLGAGYGTLSAATLRFNLSYHGGSAGILDAMRWRAGRGSLNLGGLCLTPADLATPAEKHSLEEGAAKVSVRSGQDDSENLHKITCAI